MIVTPGVLLWGDVSRTSSLLVFRSADIHGPMAENIPRLEAPEHHRMTQQGNSRYPTFQFLVGCAMFIFAIGLRAGEPEYSRDVTGWQEIPVPPKGENADRVVWDFAANYSNISWRVYVENARPSAKLIEHASDEASEPAPFDATADNFSGASRFRQVDDGWLVGFNHGEFGAALYWFNHDGTHHYKISNHQVVAFFTLSDGVYAIEGLAHMGASCGSVIRIQRPRPSARWQAMRVVRLPFAPKTVAVRRDGSIVIVLSDSLVSVDRDYHVNTLISDAAWGGLYPSSSILLSDESRLYIGMRQFVGEVDLTTNHLRLLVPSASFLNKLPEGDEKRFRAQYSQGVEGFRLPVGMCEEMERAVIQNGR
jgi:hypothetical protein